MFPDHIAFLTVTSLGRSVANSALPNSPVIDDSNDRPAVRRRLSAFRQRVSKLIRPGDVVVPSFEPVFEPQPATIPGC